MKTNIRFAGIFFAIVTIAIIGSGAYLTFKKTQPSQTDNSVPTKNYQNSRLGYSIAIPSSWVASLDESYQEEINTDSLNKDLIPESRGTEVSRYVFASNSQLLDCRDTGPEFGECVKNASSGAYTDVSATYRHKQSMSEIVANDSELFGKEIFAISPLSISGNETFVRNLFACSTCSHEITYLFNGSDNFTYEVYQLIHINPNEAVSDQEKQNITKNYQKQLNTILANLTF